MVREIDIVRGADAFNSGSGALGGTVSYRTLDAADIVKQGQKILVDLFEADMRVKNSEWVRTAAVGYVGEKFDAIVAYSQRTGHQMKSRGDGSIEDSSSRQMPDPSSHRFNSYLVKLGYQINAHHRIAFGFTGQKGERYTDERSYALYGGSWREANDEINVIILM